MKTFSQKPAEVVRGWYLIDAASAPVGRISTVAASILLGKGKPSFTPHVDGGDFVVIINADKLIVSGAKADKKVYYRHSGFPGGLYSRTLKEQQQKDSSVLLYKAIRGMLPDNKLRKQRLNRLKIYGGMEHNHTAQQPQVISMEGK